VISSPLQRARETAEAIAGGDLVSIEPRLVELDFGPWSSLTDAEIISAGHGADLQAWREQSIPPAVWNLDEAAKLSDLQTVLRECTSRSLTVAVTSNGVLKLIGRLLGGPESWSVKTANFCALQLTRACEWQIDSWNT
jgi:broad specificity phosphatase PhoE